MKRFIVYILCSRRKGTHYTGVTSDILKRTYLHKHGQVDGFTKKYHVHALAWFEVHENAGTALTRERQNTEWDRDGKIRLIEQMHPGCTDLYEQLVSGSPPSRG
jgi:putative endonuclease